MAEPNRVWQHLLNPEPNTPASGAGLAVTTDLAGEHPGMPVACPRPANSRSIIEQVRRQITDPFSRNAYALLLNTGLTGLLGIVFWLLAARYYADPDVGRGSALISTMTLLSGVVAINLTGTLSRFIPQTGRQTTRLVLFCYALSSVVVAALASGFLLTLGYWGPSFDLLRSPVTALWFIPAVVAAGIFTIQDGVLVGLRNSVWVPVENALFGISKIFLLVIFAASFPRDGVYLSWVISMVLLLLPINILIFGALIPRHVRTMGDTFVSPAPAQVGRFFAADYVGALCVYSAVYLVPVMVAARVAPQTFAYFYVAWMAAGLLNLIAINFAHSLTVEGVYEASKLAVNCRAALGRALGLLLVASVVVALAAPYCLGVLGRGYLNAASLLQILAFAAFPRAMVEVWIGVLRAQNRAREVARVQIVCGAAVVGSVLIWLQIDSVIPGLGISQITGVGWVVLASQTILALVISPGLWRFIAQAPSARFAAGAVNPPAATKLLSRPDKQPGECPNSIDAGSRIAVDPRPRAFAVVDRPARSWLPVAGVCVLTAAAAALYLFPLGDINLDKMNGYGLISVLPVASLIGLVLLTFAFIFTLSLPRPSSVILGMQLAVLLGCLYGVTALIEPLPRFPTTWVHLGFVDYISRTGTTLPGLDSRFSWAGFFAFVAFLTGKSAWQDLVPLLKLTPLLSTLLYLLPLGLLLGNLRASWEAKWFAAWLFCVLNWIGQDYFSPQGFSYWLYLVFVAVLVTWFRPGETGTATIRDPCPNSFLRRWRLPATLVPGELPARPVEQPIRVLLLLLLVGLFAVTSASHQLTPFFMVAACTGLVLSRRCVTTGLPTLLTVMLVAWLSYMTMGYWSGHLGDLVSGVGNFIGNVSTSVEARAGGNHEHHIVMYARMTFTVLLLMLSAAGLLRRRLRAIDDRLIFVLLLVPFIALGLQSYGGEIMLRVYLFALPAGCVLAAYVFFPETRSSPRSPYRFMAAGACALVLMGAFILTRYGNEQYESTRSGELVAVQYIYQQYGSAQILFMTDPPEQGATPFIPVGYRDVERVSSVGMVAPRNFNDVTGVINKMRELGPGTYLVTTRSQEAYLEVNAGYPPGWGTRFRARLATTPELQIVRQTPDAVVYTLRVPGNVSPRQPVAETGTRVGVTPWTPVGVVFVAFLVIILTAREVWRLSLPPDQHRRLRPLTFAIIPLLAGFTVVVVERLVLLAG